MKTKLEPIEKCNFCPEKHIDWEKECKYWGLPPLKIIGEAEFSNQLSSEEGNNK